MELCVVFFFQAEDGIRDYKVTGVQTCALPISVLMRNARAKGRFVAGEKMVVAGLEAAEEVFATLDPQQQLEAFTADGEEGEAGKVIPRTSGFSDVLLAGERVALNLLQHLSGGATITRQFVHAVARTNARVT